MSLPNRPYFKSDKHLMEYLTERLGQIHARQRCGIEADHHQHAFSLSGKFFHLENWYSIHNLIRLFFRCTGLHQRARDNTTKINVQHNTVYLENLPAAFDGYRLLHLSDLHGDMYAPAHHALIEAVRSVDYDLCVMTGDYRARTFGDFEPALEALETLRTHLSGTVYAVLGNHDSVFMLPAMETMGYTLLMNEGVTVKYRGGSIFLAGVDDAHYFQVDNLQLALCDQPPTIPTILLSHTPEIYHQAAYAGIDVLLCGHTHGGQICLPGGIPLTLDARCPRHMGKGAWRYRSLQGYTSAGAGTSIVNLRLNCPPEITLHTLRTAP